MPFPSQPCRDFIQGWEQCRLKRYLDSAGRPTIGWGDLLAPDDDVQECTQDEADCRLDTKLAHFAGGITDLLQVELEQNEFDALMPFTYNVGLAALRGSTMLRLINTDRRYLVPPQFGRWNQETINGVLMPNRGLTKRRAAERAIWEYSDYSGRP